MATNFKTRRTWLTTAGVTHNRAHTPTCQATGVLPLKNVCGRSACDITSGALLYAFAGVDHTIVCCIVVRGVAWPLLLSPCNTIVRPKRMTYT